jgi:hypothetical protein
MTGSSRALGTLALVAISCGHPDLKKAGQSPNDGSAGSPSALPDAGTIEGGAVTAVVACPGTSTTEPRDCAEVGVLLVPAYAARYRCYDLGPVPGVPPQRYGGLTLTLDRCSTTLLIGGSANNLEGKIYSVPVTRNIDGHVAGFAGPAAVFADAPYNDGGAVYGPDGVLFVSRYPNNELQQIKPGSTFQDKVIPLGPLGIGRSPGGLNFVPMSLPGGGAFKMVSWQGGDWYTLGLKPDGRGTFDIAGITKDAILGGGPEGFVYVSAGNPLFDVNSILVSEWTNNRISVSEVDDNGNPILGTDRPFIMGLKGAEGAYRDPATGDFFFSTWSATADRVIVVRGFNPIIE